MRVVRACLFFACMAAPIVACHLFLDDHDFTEKGPVVPPPPPPLPDAQPLVDYCQHASPPPPPDGDENPNGDEVLIFAVESMGRLVEEKVVFGFDLDRACTCFEAGTTAFDAEPSCRAPADSLVKNNCDADGGVDNAIASAVGNLPFNPSELDKIIDTQNESIHCGRQTMLFILRNWNGTPNDRKVTIGLVESNGNFEDSGTDAAASCYFPIEPEAGVDDYAFAPSFQGNDRWSVPFGKIFPQTLDSGRPLPISILSGYITNGVLVADGLEQSNPIPFILAGGVVQASTPVMRAKLVPHELDGAPFDASSDAIAPFWTMEEGLFGGRIASAEILSQVGRARTDLLPDGQAVYFCGANNGLNYALFRSFACSARDIGSTRDLDFRDKPCDALSMSFRFRGTSARLSGKTYDPPSREGGLGGCGPGFVDECPK